jgi:hypothetical protein
MLFVDDLSPRPGLSRSQTFECKPVSQILEHQLFELLGNRNPRITHTERRSNDDLTRQFPSSRQQSLGWQDFADDS